MLDAAEKAAVSIREDAQIWARNYLEESKRKADEAASARMAEISELTDSLVSRARAVAQQSDELIAAMDEAGRRVVGAAAPEQSNDFGRPRSRGRASADERRPPSRPQAPPPKPPPPPEPAGTRGGAGPTPFVLPLRSAARRSRSRLRSRARRPSPRRRRSPTRLPRAPPDRPAASSETHESPRPAGASSDGARLLATQMAVAGSSKDEIAWRLREEFGIEDSSGILAEIGI